MLFMNLMPELKKYGRNLFHGTKSNTSGTIFQLLILIISAYSIIRSWIKGPVDSSAYTKYKNTVVLLIPPPNRTMYEDYRQSNYHGKTNIKPVKISFKREPMIVVDLGHKSIRFNVIDDSGQSLYTDSLLFGGQHLTEFLMSMLRSNNQLCESRLGLIKKANNLLL